MDHEQVAEILSDVSARPSDAEWSDIDSHIGDCTRCSAAFAAFGLTVAAELALLRFELAGGSPLLGGFAGPAVFGAIGAPLIAGAVATTILLSGGSDVPATTDPATPSIVPGATATSTSTPTPTFSPSPSSAPSATAVAATRAAGTRAPATVAQVATAVPPPAPIGGADLPLPVCGQDFFAGHPASGAEFSHRFADGLVALENQERRRAEKGNLIADAAAQRAAASYARVVLEHRWWRGRSVPEWHVGPDGSTADDRLQAAGAVYRAGARMESIYYQEALGDPCGMFAEFTSVHVNNYLANYPGVTLEPLRHGTACYVDYDVEMIACVQDFLGPP